MYIPRSFVAFHIPLISDYRIFLGIIKWYKTFEEKLFVGTGTDGLKYRPLALGSSCSEVFCWKGVLRNFEKFTGKHLCYSLFFNKVAGLRVATLLKKRFWHRYFSVNFAKFLTLFLENTGGACFSALKTKT